MAARAGSRVRPPSIHGNMRFCLNRGQTKAVKTRLWLGGDAGGRPKSQREAKGCTRDIQGNNTLTTPSQHRVITVSERCCPRGTGAAPNPQSALCGQTRPAPYKYQSAEGLFFPDLSHRLWI